tara:strand:+ start:2002 stop:2688 length:687 start_codon:yes stop_codon:yes gene_type:complete
VAEISKNLTTIAIDGPAVSGKSSVGKAVASSLGYKFLDTGLMYRAATWNTVQLDIDISDHNAVVSATRAMQIAITAVSEHENSIVVNGEDVTQHLHAVTVDASVSAISAINGVREIMVSQQRSLASNGCIVIVGRDIGTFVVPDAKLKIYLTATAQTRATRRYQDFCAAGLDVKFEEILQSMEQRDLADSSRENSPLRPADDAEVVDTDDMTMYQVVDRIIELFKAKV